MNKATTWIGGATAAIVLAMGAAFFAGQSLEAQETQATAENWMTPADVLDANDSAVTNSQPAPQRTAPQPAPALQQASAPAQETPFVIKRILPIDGPIKYGDWYWDDEGVPDGPLVMTVDLDARVLSVFRGGYEIGAAAVLLGTDEHPTPLGTFPILSKERHNISEKYNNAPMPWTLRLTWDGVAIHGGATVENGYASHGCIGSPNDFVSKLYAIAKKGDKVIITRGKTAKLGDALIS